MVDSLQAVERARDAWRGMRASLIAVSGHLSEPYPDDERWTPWTRFVERGIERMDEALKAVLAALADTERERDEWIRRHDHIAQQSSGTVPVVEKLAAEARVAELEAAIRWHAPWCPDSGCPLCAMLDVAAHPSGCAKPGGEQ